MPRPDGGWQVGVGPGSVVLRGGNDPESLELAEVLGSSLAGVRSTLEGADDHPAGGRPACPVVGTGPLAARLRHALGDVPPQDGGLRVAVHAHLVPPEVGVQDARSARTTVPVVVQARRVLVGPVVGPGDGPCLHCLDLHRRDRDSAWPAVASALGHPVEQIAQPPVPEPLATATEGLVMMLVCAALSGRAVTAGLGYELGAFAPHVVMRRWAPHPACPWHRS